MKKLLLCSLILIGCTNGNPPVTAQQSETSSLYVIKDGGNFSVYKLKVDGNEYILVNGINGVAITKHR